MHAVGQKHRRIDEFIARDQKPIAPIARQAREVERAQGRRVPDLRCFSLPEPDGGFGVPSFCGEIALRETRSVVLVGSFIRHGSLRVNWCVLDTRRWLMKPEPLGPKEQLWTGIRDKDSKFAASGWSRRR